MNSELNERDIKGNFYEGSNSTKNNQTAEERSVAGAKFLDKFKNAMNREKQMYTSKQTVEQKDPKSKVTKNMTKAFTREQKVNQYEKHDQHVVGESDMNDQIKMEEVIVQGED